MKSEDKPKGLAALLAFPMIGGLILIGILLLTVIPLFFLKIHLVQVVNLQYNYNNAQQALNTILYLTEVDSTDGQTKQASKIIGEYVALQNSKPDISFLKTELDRMVANGIFNCYSMKSVHAGILATNQASCKPSKYTNFVVIATPGAPDQLVLTIDA